MTCCTGRSLYSILLLASCEFLLLTIVERENYMSTFLVALTRGSVACTAAGRHGLANLRKKRPLIPKVDGVMNTLPVSQNYGFHSSASVLGGGTPTKWNHGESSNTSLENEAYFGGPSSKVLYNELADRTSATVDACSTEEEYFACLSTLRRRQYAIYTPLHTVWNWKMKQRLAAMKEADEKPQQSEEKSHEKDNMFRPLPGERVIELDENLPDGVLEEYWAELRREREGSHEGTDGKQTSGRGQSKRKTIKVSKRRKVEDAVESLSVEGGEFWRDRLVCRLV